MFYADRAASEICITGASDVPSRQSLDNEKRFVVGGAGVVPRVNNTVERFCCETEQ
jgi:hypothetical protein